ncbi:beta-ketoacyl synthase chain length factor [Shewanella aquimarina]|uniref:beta-ketoacyl synthase chain length factor n=1 Tax=Shewanella aquimarina TaxID=260365 RepID=UPI002014B5B8|nr:beta-ketoacyl synthase chain length factor [Shewanella aquimarina]
MRLHFHIHSAGAWSPLYQQLRDWQTWPTPPTNAEQLAQAAPALKQVPAMQRRRFSKLTKMLLDVAFQCEVPPQSRTIFASRHGELNRTVDLLQDIVRQQPISPIGFSQSVHNTASGIFSILTDNRAPSTSIAAGEFTLSQALIEAYGLLAEDNAPLLLVFGDEPVSDIYKEFTKEPELPIALALQLSLAKEAPTGMQLLIETSPSTSELAEAPAIGFGQLIHAIAAKQPLEGRLNRYLLRICHD